MPDFETFLLALAHCRCFWLFVGNYIWPLVAHLSLCRMAVHLRRGHRNLDCGDASEMGDKP